MLQPSLFSSDTYVQVRGAVGTRKAFSWCKRRMRSSQSANWELPEGIMHRIWSGRQHQCSLFLCFCHPLRLLRSKRGRRRGKTKETGLQSISFFQPDKLFCHGTLQRFHCCDAPKGRTSFRLKAERTKRSEEERKHCSTSFAASWLRCDCSICRPRWTCRWVSLHSSCDGMHILQKQKMLRCRRVATAGANRLLDPN